MNYASFLNSVSLARKPSLIREMTRRMRPDIIPLSGGLPNPECFPFVKATIEASDGTKIDIEVLNRKESVAKSHVVDAAGSGDEECAAVSGDKRSARLHRPLEGGGAAL